VVDSSVLLLAIAVLVVTSFDFSNGFHDTANLVATAVASRALQPMQAALIAGAFTFIGPIVAGTAVADTVGSIVELGDLPATTAIAAVICATGGALLWNVGTWLFGMPSSSSHALVGALCGVTLVVSGTGGVHWGFEELSNGLHFVGLAKVLVALLLSPVAGFLAGYLAHTLARRLLGRTTPRVNRTIKLLQIAGTAFMAFSHGANDAQKSMGVLTLVLLLAGRLDHFAVPFWVVLLCAAAMAAGTLAGGWRIVRTLGFGVYRLRPLHALDVQIASGAVIYGSALFGGPVSTTHVVGSAIMGVGASERPRGVRWHKARGIASTWLLTVPGSAASAVVLWYMTSPLRP
jgi:PiT family inorganic phosphate transporter